MFFKKSEKKGYALHPDGAFNAIIVDINLTDNKKGTGKLLIVKYETSDGSISQFFSYEHKNKRYEAQECERLGVLVDACRLSVLQEATDLIGKKVIIKVSTPPAGPDGKVFQVIKNSKISEVKEEDLW